RDLNDGEVSDTSFFGINQEMLDVTGLMLGAVDLAILGKTLLKGANKAANNKYMKGIDQVSTPKTRFKRGQDRRQKEMAMRVRQAVEESRAIRKASKDKRDLYFKKEKELYEALKKKKASSSGSFEGTGQGGHRFPTRLINPEAEGHILQRVSELKGRLSNGALNKSGANFGYAEVDIPGIKNEFYAHSQVDGPSPPHQPGINYDGFSYKPQGEVRYPAEDAPNSLGKIISRNSDTEHKIINDLANQLGPPNPNIKGRMKLFTENDTCISCNKNISDFQKDYPGITIEVIHNGDKKVPKK
ncbi:deaminase domain-containing protein, partial [Paenibacillus lautus]|uniref:deaminase domain-containing protein n=1 Tax=Paenibacillus lautus TaxID=1401 RepID=UPI003D28052C